MVLCAISLGGNLGDVPGTFAEAVRLLTSTPGIFDLRMSRLYRTTPMGAVAGDAFFNAVAVFETTLLPLPLLALLQEMETHCGRVRTVHWGPRTLDLDLLLYGEQIIQSPPMASAGSPRLTVPHPAMWYRRFVLDPLAELIPDAVHPVFQKTIADLRRRLLERPLPVGWAVPTSSGESRKMVGTAHPTVRWLLDGSQAWESVTMVFAGAKDVVTSPRVIRLPADETAARQMVIDVLTAVLDEPAVI